ncbi:MAG: asparaginase [Anaerolineales bacterium]
METSAYVPVYALSRGEKTESVHYGAAALVSATGKLIAAIGDPTLSAYLRSTAKPLQALPFVMAGGMAYYGLGPKELALICSSHSGTDEQVRVLTELQQKVGVDEGQLLCGVHPPFHEPTRKELEKHGFPPTPNRHDCSGKHTGMLAYAKMRGWALDNYVDKDHLLQQELINFFLVLAGVEESDLQLGIDGCSAPNWSAPLFNTALAYARLMDPSALPNAQADACIQVREAMLAHPEMVAGPERFDTDLMKTTGRILAKAGAEGFQGLGLPAGAIGPGSPALGIALKIADGDARGWARPAVALEILRQLVAIPEDELVKLKHYGPDRPISNWRGLVVGQASPTFILERP